MGRLPVYLVGRLGYKTVPPSGLSPLTTVTISVPDKAHAMGLVDSWGETLPYSAYPGFFRLVLLSREGEKAFRSGPYCATLAEAATNWRDTSERFDNPIYDRVIGLDVVYWEPASPVEAPPTDKPSGEIHPKPKHGADGKFKSWTQSERVRYFIDKHPEIQSPSKIAKRLNLKDSSVRRALHEIRKGKKRK